VVLTPQGAATFDEAMRRWAPWTRRLAATVTPEALAVTRSCLAALRAQLARDEALARESLQGLATATTSGPLS
jgi:hypothetical protein